MRKKSSTPYTSIRSSVPDEIAAYIAKLENTVIKSMYDISSEIQDSASNTTPVKTGKLRDSLKQYTKIDDDSISVGLTYDIEYGYYVRVKGTKKSVWRELLLKPANKRASELAALITKGLS